MTRKAAAPPKRPRLAAIKASSSGIGTIGIELVLSVLLGLFGGRALDRWLGTTPWLSVIGFGFGVAAGGRAIWRAYREMQEITKREEREQGNPEPVWDKREPANEDDEDDRAVSAQGTKKDSGDSRSQKR